MLKPSGSKKASFFTLHAWQHLIVNIQTGHETISLLSKLELNWLLYLFIISRKASISQGRCPLLL